MEKVTFDIHNDDTAGQQKLAEELLKDDRVRELLDKYGADEKTVYENAYTVREWLDSLDSRAQDFGTVSLENDGSRYYKDLEIDEGEVRIVLKKTTMQKENDRRFSLKDNYLMCDLSDEMLEYDLKDIDLSGESESYRKVVEIASKWLRSLPDKGLYFWGGLGVGKTYIAAAMTNYLARKGNKVAFVNVPSFFARARSSISSQEFGRISFVESAVRRLKRADFLVLDDIGAENVTNWVRDDILLPVLDYRMENHKSTLFTSNSDFADLRQRLMYNQYGQKEEMKADRIMERIRTLSMEIHVEGTSRRK